MITLLWPIRVAAGLLIFITAHAVNVWAHATLVRSVPADGALLAEAPQEVRLWFNENISPRFSAAQLLDSKSQPVQLAGIRTDPSDPKQLILSLRQLPAGVYSVLAKTLSEADGHFSRSLLVFGVGEEADLKAAVVLPEKVPPWPEVVLRWGNFTLLAALVGAVAVVYLVLVPVGAALAAVPASTMALGVAERRVLAWAFCCTGLALLVGLGLLLWQCITLAATLPEGSSFPGVVWQVLSRTRWGALWLARQGLLLVFMGVVYCMYHARHQLVESRPAADAAAAPAAVVPLVTPSLTLPPRGRGRGLTRVCFFLSDYFSIDNISYTPLASPRWWEVKTCDDVSSRSLRQENLPQKGGKGGRVAKLVAALFSLALLTVQALTGHAAAVTPQTTLAVVTASLHLLAASLWIGGLLALGVGLWPLMRRDWVAATTLAYASWGRFSRVAAVSVGLLVATGLYNMRWQVASLDALVTALYGQVLLAKIGLVLVVGACGLLNAMLLHPVVAAPLAWLLHRPQGWTPCSLTCLLTLVLGEAGLGLLVLLATSVVTAAPPPRGPEFTIEPADVPATLSKTVNDVVVTLSVKPNRPGQNVFTVFTASTRRPPRAEITRVIL
ncbi:MAG TPA: copper resistance protein CopC, partial [Candidatus Tectomicrobia bacterium]